MFKIQKVTRNPNNGVVEEIEILFNDYLTLRCAFDYNNEKVVIISRTVPDEVLRDYSVLLLTTHQKGELFKVCRGIFESSFQKANPEQLDLFFDT